MSTTLARLLSRLRLLSLMLVTLALPAAMLAPVSAHAAGKIEVTAAVTDYCYGKTPYSAVGINFMNTTEEWRTYSITTRKPNGDVVSYTGSVIAPGEMTGPSMQDLDMFGTYHVTVTGDDGSTGEVSFETKLCTLVDIEEVSRTPSTIEGDLGDGSVTFLVTYANHLQQEHVTDLTIFSGANPSDQQVLTIMSLERQRVTLGGLGFTGQKTEIFIRYMQKDFGLQERVFYLDPIQYKEPVVTPKPAKPSVDAVELTRVVGNGKIPVTIKVKNNGRLAETYTLRITRSGKLVATPKVRVGAGKTARITPALGAGNYRVTAINAAGSAYDDFRVVKYPNPSVKRKGKAYKADFRVKAPYTAKIGYQTLKKGKWSSTKWVNKGRTVKANKTVTVNTPNAKKRKPTTVRFIVDKKGVGYWVSGSYRSRR